MVNKIIKNLIILGAIIFTFALTNGVSAYYNPYDSSNWLVPVSGGNSMNSPYDPGTAYAAQFYGYQQYNHAMQPAVPYNSPFYNSGNLGYSQYDYYQQAGYANTTPIVEPKTSIVNNYYQTAPTTVKKETNTTSSYGTPISNTHVNNANIPASGVPTNTVMNNSNASGYSNLGASAYNSGYGQPGAGITALSLRGSGGFMPSSIWQWIFVIILILVIIIIARTLAHKPTVSQEHAQHAH